MCTARVSDAHLYLGCFDGGIMAVTNFKQASESASARRESERDRHIGQGVHVA